MWALLMNFFSRGKWSFSCNLWLALVLTLHLASIIPHHTWPKSSKYFITTSGQAKNYKNRVKRVSKLHTKVISTFVEVPAAGAVFCINDLHFYTTNPLQMIFAGDDDVESVWGSSPIEGVKSVQIHWWKSECKYKLERWRWKCQVHRKSLMQ